MRYDTLHTNKRQKFILDVQSLFFSFFKYKIEMIVCFLTSISWCTFILNRFVL